MIVGHSCLLRRAVLRFRFTSKKLEALYYDERGARKYPDGVIEAFVEAMAIIRNGKDERDLRALKGLRYHRLKGNRKHQHSIYLNAQFRLVLEWEEDQRGKCLLVIDIEDYH